MREDHRSCCTIVLFTRILLPFFQFLLSFSNTFVDNFIFLRLNPIEFGKCVFNVILQFLFFYLAVFVELERNVSDNVSMWRNKLYERLGSPIMIDVTEIPSCINSSWKLPSAFAFYTHHVLFLSNTLEHALKKHLQQFSNKVKLLCMYGTFISFLRWCGLSHLKGSGGGPLGLSPSLMPNTSWKHCLFKSWSIKLWCKSFPQHIGGPCLRRHFSSSLAASSSRLFLTCNSVVSGDE